MKSQAAHRWIRAVNSDGSSGFWDYAIVSDMSKLGEVISRAANMTGSGNVVENA